MKGHPDLRGRLVYSYNYLTASAEGGDDCGHGTHICGIIGGTGEASGGRYQGLAPRCHFLSLKVLDREGNGSSASLARALYWLIEHGREYDVRIVNISAGSAEIQGRKKSGLLKAVEEAWDAGFLICAAAGNQGPRPVQHHGTGNKPQGHHGRLLRRQPRRAVSGREEDGLFRAGGRTAACVCKPDVGGAGGLYPLLQCGF